MYTGTTFRDQTTIRGPWNGLLWSSDQENKVISWK
jgi:hypothetical protein